MDSGYLLTRSGLTYPEVSSNVCPASFLANCQWSNFPWKGYEPRTG